MAHSTILLEINNEDDCQLASLTNKLPYYARRLCKSSNKNMASAGLTEPREYSSGRLQYLIYKTDEKIFFSL
jgi:hypothetical protein